MHRIENNTRNSPRPMPSLNVADATSASAASCRCAPSPAKRLSLEKLMAIQRDIVTLDRKILQLRNKLDTRKESLGSSTTTPELMRQYTSPDELSASPLVPLFPAQVSVEADDDAMEYDPETMRIMMAGELCRLAALNDVNGMRVLLGTGGDPNCVDYDQRTPLHIAAERGNTDAVRLLLQFRGNPNLLDEDGRTPASLAAEHGFQELHDMLMFVNVEANYEPESFNEGASMASSPPELGHTAVDLAVRSGNESREDNMVVVMVGLPGRGKTYVAQHIQRYCSWNRYKCTVITHQSLRKKAAGTTSSYPSHIPDLEIRVAKQLADEVKEFFATGGNVVLVDGTHSTQNRRQTIRQVILDETGLPSSRILFVEVYSNDAELIMSNIMKARLTSSRCNSATFVEDYLENMRQHEAVYRTLSVASDPDFSFIRIDHQTTYDLHRVDGWLQSRLAYMLHNLRHTPQPLYLSRSGEYEDLVSGRIGGNSRLTKRGEAYSRALHEFMRKEMTGQPFVVMSSCATRCTQTVRHFVNSAIRSAQTPFQEPPAPAHLPPPPPHTTLSTESMNSGSETPTTTATYQPSQATSTSGMPTTLSSAVGTVGGGEREKTVNCRVVYLPTLDDLNHGDCEGQLLSDILATLPNTMASMKADRYHVAWPNGESIQQLFSGRLEPHIHEIQNSTQPLLIVSHEPLIQGFHAYFVRDAEGHTIAPEDAHKICIPQHAVIRVVQGIDRRVAEIIDLEPQVNEYLQKDKSSAKNTMGRKQFTNAVDDDGGQGESSPLLPQSIQESGGAMTHRGSVVW